MKRIVLATLALAAACSESDPLVPTAKVALERVPADCEGGPASSLAAEIVAQLPPRNPARQPDVSWAELAATVPGGFAGVMEENGVKLLLLTRPDEAQAAKTALASAPALQGFPVQTATVRQVRWDFKQLIDWYDYLVPKLGQITSSDNDEALNRIRLGWATRSARDATVQALLSVPNLPCDLVVIDSVAVPAFHDR
jgi:hypothetical protein